ncbi:MAG: tyrosine--tRNA ligase [Polyangiaceae bacterium]|nr:tyrosine--tRNA ligase [Polyangiaceae bacterium]
MLTLLEDLTARGLVYQQTHAEAFAEHLAQPRRVYCGFDPTSDSLTVGNLLALQLLARFQRAGHTPVIILGGGTGLIGDPSGKSAERPTLDASEISANVLSQSRIFRRLFNFDGPNAALVLNNGDWLSKLGFLEALRDIGKHFSVNMMIQKDSVRERLHGREQGISYTEFSYMLLQAYDFLYLLDHNSVTVQVAGSDQWGNIVAGVDLIRRLRKTEVFGFTSPLITKSDGTKFGKTESGAIWLTAERTSPYQFYQFWVNTADDEVEKYLKVFTHFSLGEIAELLGQQASDPAARPAQRALASHMTELLHGPEARLQAEQASAALFSGEVRELPEALLEEVLASAPSSAHTLSSLTGLGVPAVDLLVEAGVASSKRQAREFLSNGAILFNGNKIGAEAAVTQSDLLHGKLLLIRRGKKAWHVTRWS